MTFSRSGWLIVHGADPLKWAKRYGIEPFTHLCGGCGASMTTSIAFVSGKCRGLVAPKCACGSEPPYCIVGAWDSLFEPAKPTHRSSGVHRTYERVEDRRKWPRKCRYKGCKNANTHRGMGDGMCLTSGCEWHMAKWAREGKGRASPPPRRSA